MNTRTASACGVPAYRSLIAVNLLNWTLSLGVTARTRKADLTPRGRERALRRADIPRHLREDVGLPAEEPENLHDLAVRLVFFL